MVQHLDIPLAGETLYLLGERGIYWPARRSLLLADLHLGKAGHFRKNGVPIPGQVMQQDLDRLDHLIEQYDVSELVMLGDLFHSYDNEEVGQFGRWLTQKALRCRLIEGNHDILARHRYPELGIEVQAEGTPMGPFLLRHHPLAEAKAAASAGYILAGHIHPGVRLLGGGRQTLRLPCFHFGPHQGLLPAFGSFTGLGIIEPVAADQVYAIAEGEVLAL